MVKIEFDLKGIERIKLKTIIEIANEHIRWRYQIFNLAKSDLKKTYSGAALGWFWAIIKPLITILVYWFAFSVGLRQGRVIEGYPYILWIVAGIIPWFYMTEMITQGASAIRSYKFLVTKMKFPVSTIPTFVGISKLAVHLFLLSIVFVLFILMGFFPDIYMLQLPIYMFLMVVFFILWALFSSMLSSISKDFLNLVKSIVTAVFWMSGILWDINSINTPWIKTILMFNPVTFVATGYRNCFIYKVWIWEQPEAFGAFAVMLVIMFVAAMWSYKKLIREIPDVL